MKHRLKCRYYLRYCDDFVLLSRDRAQLLSWREHIAAFLQERLKLALNPTRQRLQPVSNGIDWLGYIVWSRTFGDHCFFRQLRRLVRLGLLRDVDAEGFFFPMLVNSTSGTGLVSSSNGRLFLSGGTASRSTIPMTA